MQADSRRQSIIKVLTGCAGPVSAGKLAGMFGVSRQIIVGDIALLCGFHDPLYFSRMFKAKYGTAPRNYLESRLKQPIVRPDENSVRVQL